MLRRDTIIALRTFVQSASSLTALTTSINNIKSNIIIGSYCDSRSHLYISDHQISPLHTTLCKLGILSNAFKNSIREGLCSFLYTPTFIYILNNHLIPSICGSFFISAFPHIPSVDAGSAWRGQAGLAGSAGPGSLSCVRAVTGERRDPGTQREHTRRHDNSDNNVTC